MNNMATQVQTNINTVAYMGKRYLIEWRTAQQRLAEVRRIKEDAHISVLEKKA